MSKIASFIMAFVIYGWIAFRYRSSCQPIKTLTGAENRALRLREIQEKELAKNLAWEQLILAQNKFDQICKEHRLLVQRVNRWHPYGPWNDGYEWDAKATPVAAEPDLGRSIVVFLKKGYDGITL